MAETAAPALDAKPARAVALLLERALPFSLENRLSALDELPEACGLFALFAEDARAEPYLAKATNLRRRLQRFLQPAATQTRRLQLAGRIRRIEYTETGSDFASDLAFYHAATLVEAQHGGSGRTAGKRLRLRPAAFLRIGMENRFPRAFTTTKFGRASAMTFQPVGPFPSKAAAERYLEEVLDLFHLRRCVENLHPDPAHPGCAYSEMKKCLAPCYGGCTEERYRQEATAVAQFLATRGKSLLERIDAERKSASEQLAFEQAAMLHQRFLKVEAVAGHMPEAARSLNHLSGVIVQPGSSLDCVALFGLTRGAISAPVSFSVLGMRLHNELSGSSSLYTQPMALQPVALSDGAAPAELSRDMLEDRLDEALAALQAKPVPPAKQLEDHLSLFARWFYRAQTRRVGEVLFVDAAGQLPRKPLLRAISRVAAAAQFGFKAGQKPSQWHS